MHSIILLLSAFLFSCENKISLKRNLGLDLPYKQGKAVQEAKYDSITPEGWEKMLRTNKDRWLIKLLFSTPEELQAIIEALKAMIEDNPPLQKAYDILKYCGVSHENIKLLRLAIFVFVLERGELEVEVGKKIKHPVFKNIPDFKEFISNLLVKSGLDVNLDEPLDERSKQHLDAFLGLFDSLAAAWKAYFLKAMDML